MAIRKIFKASDKKKYTINRLWAYDNLLFCDKGKQKKANVKYIVVHNTGNAGKDTAKANANYFKNNRKNYAGAHFVIDLDGIIYQSGRLTDACYSVGGAKYSNCDKTGGGKYYKKCTNYNQISIELAGIVDNKPTKEQIASTKAIIEYIQKYCKNAKEVLRHFDVTGKECPKRYLNDKTWKTFKKKIY